MDAELKRKRSQNWESTDKSLLRHLITKKIAIIENKNVDTNTSRKKRDAWYEIQQTFNQSSTITRSIAQIQCQWRGMKMQAKSRLSQDKKSLSATEGGTPPKSPNGEDTDLLTPFPEEFEVDCNTYDSDAVNVEYMKVEIEEPVIENFPAEIPEESAEISNEEVPDQPKKKRKTKNYAVTSEEMKVDLFEITTSVKKAEMKFLKAEHEKRMEILQMEMQLKEEENARREKEHLIRMNILFKKENAFLDVFDGELLSRTEPSATCKRCNSNKKWTVAKERKLVDFLLENRGFEKPTAQAYYKCFAEESKINVDWKLARSKVRNMRRVYNKAKSWVEALTGSGSMNGETMEATLLKKCHFFYEFDEFFGARLADNVMIEDTLDTSLSCDGWNSTENDTDETTTSSLRYESGQSTHRKGINSRTGVSDIMKLQSEIMMLKKKKFEKDVALDKGVQYRERELALKEKEIEVKQKEIESKERFQILELEMKERLATEELKLKYK